MKKHTDIGIKDNYVVEIVEQWRYTDSAERATEKKVPSAVCTSTHTQCAFIHYAGGGWPSMQVLIVEVEDEQEKSRIEDDARR